ncbi:Cell division protein ZapA [Jannaschia seosinensis]|uniref:Cell division protein ZapA n=1 Tax=Jannaschia seosinensis TaxID=313367 RepID=A0A0M7BHX9_9RHOB|nr:cell division protein ZapA [Jannaschia seosinensis]CUH40946.1 Cell division protein ZapA [Jannaschia seosinensis]
MPDMTIEIGGRPFKVACQEGEESYLSAAAEALDREARTLGGKDSRLPAERMLLMAGLMLADKTISAEEELRTLDRRLAQQTQLLDEMQRRDASAKETVPDAAIERLDALAARAEEMAARAREMVEPQSA